MLVLVTNGRIKDRNGNLKRRGELADITDSQADFYSHRIEYNQKQKEGSFPDGYPVADRLIEAGYNNLDEVAMASDEELLSVDGVGKATVEKIRNGSFGN